LPAPGRKAGLIHWRRRRRSLEAKVLAVEVCSHSPLLRTELRRGFRRRRRSAGERHPWGGLSPLEQRARTLHCGRREPPAQSHRRARRHCRGLWQLSSHAIARRMSRVSRLHHHRLDTITTDSATRILLAEAPSALGWFQWHSMDSESSVVYLRETLEAAGTAPPLLEPTASLQISRRRRC
jgi:hypothetical protein